MAAAHHPARRGPAARHCAHGRPAPAARRRTAILFVDLVDSTATALRMGDEAWCDLLDAFDAEVRRSVRDGGGALVKTLGDGALVRSDEPVDAVAIAHRIIDRAAALGLRVRAGVHVAEVRVRADGDLAGIGVHIGARVADRAAEGEVWCTDDAADALTAAGVLTAARGRHDLKGLDGPWALHAAAPPAAVADPAIDWATDRIHAPR